MEKKVKAIAKAKSKINLDAEHPYLEEFAKRHNIKIPWPYGANGNAAFDKRETYDLHITLVAQLYERLRFLIEKGGKIVNFEYHKYEYNGKEITMVECIREMIADCEYILSYRDIFKNEQELIAAKDDLFDRMKLIFFALWW